MICRRKIADLFIKDKDTEFCAEELEKLYSSKDEITADIILNSLEKDLDFMKIIRKSLIHCRYLQIMLEL